MSPRRKVALSLLAAHVLLLPQFLSLNQRLPKDLLILPFELVLQLILLALVAGFLAALFLLLGWGLSELPDPAGQWIWPLMGAATLGRLVAYTANAAFPMARLHLGLAEATWAIVIPSLIVLATGLLSIGVASRWISAACVLGMFTMAGLWFPQLSSLVTWSSRRPPAPRPAQQKQESSTIWVFIFDEFDGELAWDPTLSPRLSKELEAWRSQSFTIPHALRAGPSTQTAISGLLLGRTLLGSTPYSIGGIGLNLTESNGTTTRWNGSDSLFHAWVEGGGSFRVLGWFFPYKTWFGAFSSQAIQYTAHFGKKGYHLHVPLAERFFFTLKSCFIEKPYSQDEAAMVGRDYAKWIKADLDQRVTALQATDHHGLIWIHWPVPHPPNLNEDGRPGYSGNLDLVAEVLERFRITQIASGAWDRDIMIVTGDHGLRPEHYGQFFDSKHYPNPLDGGKQVPFMCRLPGIKTGRDYNSPVATAGLRELLLSIQDGRVKSYNDLEEWARNHPPLPNPSK